MENKKKRKESMIWFWLINQIKTKDKTIKQNEMISNRKKRVPGEGITNPIKASNLDYPKLKQGSKS